MRTPEIKAGLVAGYLPFVRLGNGPRALAIFPGLADAAWDVTSRTWDLPAQYPRFVDEFTIFVISRRRGLPRGYTTRDMAADYTRVFETEIGPAVVLGISLGGCIAQHFAVDFPQHVKRLVIAFVANRVSDQGRKIPERWLQLARQKRWTSFYLGIAKVTRQEYPYTFHQFLLPRLWKPRADPSDFLVSLEASVVHNGSAVLGRILAPTLVIGGTRDVFFRRHCCARSPGASPARHCG